MVCRTERDAKYGMTGRASPHSSGHCCLPSIFCPSPMLWSVYEKCPVKYRTKNPTNGRSLLYPLCAPTFPQLRIPRRSEERRVGKGVSVRVDLGGRRIIKKKKTKQK